MIAGGVAVKAILQRAEGIMKLRGRWFTHTLSDGSTIPVLPTYHPAFLLRSPAQKRDAWRDLMEIQVKLEEVDRPQP
jgi:DNA polymerase